MSMSPEEVRKLVREAVRETLAERPTPSNVTVAQAAELLKVSVRTVSRMNLPRDRTGKIPYSAVLDALAAK